MSGTTPRPLRADAARNRAQIVRAARAAFDADGVDLSMDDVAARAGVGKATLYRTFSSRDVLINAVAAEQLTTFLDATRRALDDDGDPLELLRALLCRPPNVEDSPRIVSVLGPGCGMLTPAVRSLQQRAMAGIDTLLDRAKARGDVRPEVTSTHVTVLYSGVARALPDHQRSDPAVYEEYHRLIFNALVAR